ncbi:primosomal protein N' [Advenella mandrilli]|uniref:primosomal protein N' n=1 Tax=Advenella mandrilli TaxID=2800330 RepID=UPI001F1ED07A|nr:primosomal protein N' [Advenella mandrilli]
MKHTQWIRVALDVPLAGPFDYRVPASLKAAKGQRVLVPFGRRELVGIVLETMESPSYPEDQVKDILMVFDDLPALPQDWLDFGQFAASYYHRPVGEVLLPAMPSTLRKPGSYTGKLSKGGPVARLDRRKKTGKTPEPPEDKMYVLNPEQQDAVDAVQAIEGFKTVLLHGVTGSGKTEVYLHLALDVLTKGKQVLFLVPEINLTPQFEQALLARFQQVVGLDGIAVLHSGLADGERLKAWVAIQRGQARVVLGTRMAIFAPLQESGLIIVDEEHDASYKQQEGLRYSARDLAIWRAHQLSIPVVLGSATPSLESWHHANVGRYLKLSLTKRAKTTYMPAIKLVDTKQLKLEQGFAPVVLQSIRERFERGEQSLVFLNRRGYAPVIHCASCSWMSQCPRCSVYTVMHRMPGHGNVLQCHHCGYYGRVPVKCPDCGNQDLEMLGRGTQRVEEFLRDVFPDACVERIDADSTRLKGSARQLFDRVHSGEIDILVGTQMVAKGHDFRKLGLVCVLNADAMLFSSDFRAPEKLFAQLVQVSGRAGRHVAGGEVLIQTAYPEQAVYQALIRHNYDTFANASLEERKITSLPPFSHHVLITAQAKTVNEAMQFLQETKQQLITEPQLAGFQAVINMYDPVPLRIVRVAHVERAQLLIESASRPVLQAFLGYWLPLVQDIGRRHRIRYFTEVDPLEI